jgi:hypothetical protein
MTREIRPSNLDDIAELSRFLTNGFRTAAEADFAAPEVLRWKYFEAVGTTTTVSRGLVDNRDSRDHGDGPEDAHTAAEASLGAPRSYLARDDEGPIIGHLGVCRTTFEGHAINALGGRVTTIHVIDWLGSPEHRSVGSSLLRRAHQGVETQFSLGATQVAEAVGERTGYKVREQVPVYVRVLRPLYWLRTAGLSPLKRALRLARVAGGALTRPRQAPRATIIPRRTPEFGPEIGPIVAKAKADVILTDRDPVRLNGFLRFPRQVMSGWHLLDQTGRLRGFAMLNVVPGDQGRTRTGKIVDCLLDSTEVDLWHAALAALTGELSRQGADLAQAYASTPWTAEALRRSGYTSRFAVKFLFRDRLELVPDHARFYLTLLEGDYAYT